MTQKIIKILINLTIYAAIVAGILFGLPKFLVWYMGTPYPIAAITSGSMWPVLKTGDLVFIQRVEKSDLAIGDIVVWQNPQGFTIHRIVKLDADTVTTKGDANFTEDEPVAYADIVGRTYQIFGRNARVPYFGMITVYAHKR